MTLFLRGLIWLYRHSLSLFLGRHCRFLPTCSAYADEALRRYGAVKGGKMAVKRFCRCHPWGGSGWDPVPPASEGQGQVLNKMRVLTLGFVRYR